MSQVITFEDFTPTARYDAIPWTEARIEEATASGGPWTQIDVAAISPVDADPSDPAARSFTTELASDTPGLWYRIVFADATGDTLLPTSPIQNSTQLYITRTEMKAALSMGGEDYADADIDRACSAVSRALDEAVRPGGSHFYQATETRYYTPDDFNYTYTAGEHRLGIDDLVSASSVTVDTTGDGSYATTWVEGTDFFLDPANAATDGKPYEELLLRINGGRYFPRVQRAVKVTGTFGWPSVPAQVSQYAVFFVSQTILRTRQAPFGILMQGMEVGAVARIMRFDPDFDRFVGPFTRKRLII